MASLTVSPAAFCADFPSLTCGCAAFWGWTLSADLGCVLVVGACSNDAGLRGCRGDTDCEGGALLPCCCCDGRTGEIRNGAASVSSGTESDLATTGSIASTAVRAAAGGAGTALLHDALVMSANALKAAADGGALPVDAVPTAGSFLLTFAGPAFMPTASAALTASGLRGGGSSFTVSFATVGCHSFLCGSVIVAVASDALERRQAAERSGTGRARAAEDLEEASLSLSCEGCGPVCRDGFDGRVGVCADPAGSGAVFAAEAVVLAFAP